MRTLEVALDKLHCDILHDCVNAINRYYTSSQSELKQYSWAMKISGELHRGLHNLQLQDYIQRKISALEDQSKIVKLTEDEREQLEIWRSKLFQLKKDYWQHDRVWYELQQDKPGGAYVRMIHAGLRREERKLLRKGLNVNMMPAWIDWCKGTSGCCSRDCGCCAKPRATTQRSGEIHSHCTLDCACCIENRGFERAGPKDSDEDCKYCKQTWWT